MNSKAFIGTIIWIVVVFIVISATIFFFSLKDEITSDENKTEQGNEDINNSFEQNDVTIVEVPTSYTINNQS